MPEETVVTTTSLSSARRAVDAPGQRLTLTSWLLALAVLLHQQQLDDWDAPSVGLLLSALAAWLLLRPSSRRLLVAVLVVHAVSALADLPFVVNHWLLLLMIEATAAVAVVVGLALRRPWARDPAAVFERLAPAVRLQLVLVYLAAALSKLNSDFVDPDLSCGVAMVDRLLTPGPLDLRMSWLDGPAIWGTIALELLLPVLLLWRRTRVPALFVGLGFHAAMAAAGHVPFSGFALVFLALFAPDDVLGRARGVLDARPALQRLLDRVRDQARRPVAVLVAGAAVLLVAGAQRVDVLDAAVTHAALLVLLAVTVALATALLACLRVGGPVTYAPHSLRPAGVLWLAPLLVVLNAASPYLGSRTQTTFTMYSNLQTEGAAWNHLLVPQAVQVLPSQDHVVRLVSSSDRRMQQAADTGRLWVFDGLRAWASRNPDASLVYVDDGERVTVDRVGSDPRFDIGPVAARWSFYRDVPQGQDNRCRTLRRDSAEQHS